MALGISFGAQECSVGQFSEVNVNGTRISSSTGREDDGTCFDGAQYTTGGIGDTNANPADLFATDNRDLPQDDELCDLIPFVSDGDTAITVWTLIRPIMTTFFCGLFLSSVEAQVVSEHNYHYAVKFLCSEVGREGNSVRR